MIVTPSEALKSSEARNRAFLEFAYDAFVAMDVEGRIIEWNLQAEKTFGWDKKEVLGQTLSEILIPGHFREAHRRGLAHYMASGEGPVLNTRIEVPVLHRSGREISMELTVYPIEQSEGVIFGAFLHDISEQKRNAQLQSMQLKVTEALTKFNTLPEVVPELLEKICQSMGWRAGEFWLVEGTNLWCRGAWHEPSMANKEFSELTLHTPFQKSMGLPGTVWESKTPLWVEDLSTQLNSPRFEAAEKAGYKSALAFPLKTSGEIVGAMVFFLAQQTSMEARILEALVDVGSYVGLFIQRRQAEDKLSRLYQELEYKIDERTRDLALALEQAKTANRLKDEFLATVSHELRTPLGVIIGYTDLLLETPMTEDEKVDALEKIRRNGRTQVQIIGDLLDVSRIITGKMQMDFANVDLKNAISSAVESMQITAAAKGIELITDLNVEIGSVWGDSGRLQQILWNLLSNAVKFTSRAGKISISLKQHLSYACIEITDSGKGIEPSFIPYVFERFRQEDASTTRQYGGLGLGLAIVRHLVEAHGGTVSVNSRGLGHGAKFTVHLPLGAGDDRLGAAASYVKSRITTSPKQQRQKPLLGLKVLAVEDDPDTRVLIGGILKSAGADVLLAGSVAEGFALFQREIPDLLISDISMPGQDGYALISSVRSLSPQQGGRVTAIAFTAHVRQSEKERMLSKGFNYHIAKPVAAEELIEQIQKLLGL